MINYGLRWDGRNALFNSAQGGQWAAIETEGCGSGKAGTGIAGAPRVANGT